MKPSTILSSVESMKIQTTLAQTVKQSRTKYDESESSDSVFVKIGK